MSPAVIIPVAIAVAALVGFWTWYRRKIKDLTVDDAVRPVPGARLTAERLRSLVNPPWRVVYEIGGSTLGDVDHVVIGPTGVIAIESRVADRPTDAAPTDATAIAAAAVARGDVDDLARLVGSRCDVLARVYWGTPQPDRPAAVEVAPGHLAIEGQRLIDWLHNAPPGPLTASQVDLVWQTIVTGIGRPDPLA